MGIVIFVAPYFGFRDFTAHCENYRFPAFFATGLKSPLDGVGVRSFLAPMLMSHRVLVIDDDSQATEVLERLLTGFGYLVKTETTSGKSLTVARDYQPDTVILDFLMPDPHGGDVAWQLASDSQLEHTPHIILCSGVPTDQFSLKLPPIKIDIVEKPVDLDRLLELLGSADLAVEHVA